MQVGALSGGQTTAELLQIGVQTRRASSLEVVTAEGDRVTISTSSTRSLGYASASGADAGSSVRGEALQVTGSDSVSIALEGSLSKEELQDLQKVIKSFQRAASRNDASQFLQRLSASDIDTISTVSGSASTEVLVTATQVQASTDVGDGAAAPSRHEDDHARGAHHSRHRRADGHRQGHQPNASPEQD